MSALVSAWHMGALHPHEKALTLLLAFGPFVLLGVVIVVRRRQDRREDDGTAPSSTSERQRER
ncbi:MAG: hypothetical protein JWM79_454 [Nocardioides sp.]|nr:hypothetical protein [Nocardioides sp.]